MTIVVEPMTYGQSPTLVRRKEAQDAIASAQRQLEEILANSVEVRRVTSSLRDIRRHNHFAERIEQSMRLGGPSQ